MSAAAMAQFRDLVLSERDLQARLRDERDRSAFVRLVVELAGSRGLGVVAEDVEAALADARRAWMERWA